MFMPHWNTIPLGYTFLLELTLCNTFFVFLYLCESLWGKWASTNLIPPHKDKGKEIEQSFERIFFLSFLIQIHSPEQRWISLGKIKQTKKLQEKPLGLFQKSPSKQAYGTLKNKATFDYSGAHKYSYPPGGNHVPFHSNPSMAKQMGKLCRCNKFVVPIIFATK